MSSTLTATAKKMSRFLCLYWLSGATSRLVAGVISAALPWARVIHQSWPACIPSFPVAWSLRPTHTEAGKKAFSDSDKACRELKIDVWNLFNFFTSLRDSIINCLSTMTKV